MYIGVDIGGTNLAVGLVDDSGRILERVKAPCNASRGARAVIDNVSELCFEVTKKAGRLPSDIQWIGMGTPGSVDSKNGVIIFAGNIPYDNTPAAAWMKERWDCPIFVDNDANAAALGEVFSGAAKDCNSALLVTLGTGIGGGIVLDRKVYSGFNGLAGEIGHTVIEVDGWQCSCGRCGCWEAYSSATGLIRMTKEAMAQHPGSLIHEIVLRDKKVSGKTSFIAAREGDKAGQETVDRYIKYLSHGLANMINVLQPEMLCVGGGVCNEGDSLMVPLIEATHAQEFKGSRNNTVIRLAELGNDAGIIGAAMLGKQ